MVRYVQPATATATAALVSCFPDAAAAAAAALAFSTSSSSSSSSAAADDGWIRGFLRQHRRDRDNPSPDSQQQLSLRESLDRAGISKLFFLRHGKTLPKPHGGRDFDRVLADQGRQQARDAGKSYGRAVLRPFYHRALVSPAPRTVESCELFLEGAAAGSSASVEVHLTPIQALYDGTMQPEGSKLFRKIGYAPLRDYVESNDSDDRRVARRVLGQYGRSVVECIADALEEDGRSGVDAGQRQQQGTTLLLVGHAIYLPAAAYAVAVSSITDASPAALDVVSSSNTREAEGYLIDLPTSSVRYLSRPDENEE